MPPSQSDVAEEIVPAPLTRSQFLEFCAWSAVCAATIQTLAGLGSICAVLAGLYLGRFWSAPYRRPQIWLAAAAVAPLLTLAVNFWSTEISTPWQSILGRAAIGLQFSVEIPFWASALFGFMRGVCAFLLGGLLLKVSGFLANTRGTSRFLGLVFPLLAAVQLAFSALWISDALFKPNPRSYVERLDRGLSVAPVPNHVPPWHVEQQYADLIVSQNCPACDRNDCSQMACVLRLRRGAASSCSLYLPVTGLGPLTMRRAPRADLLFIGDESRRFAYRASSLDCVNATGANVLAVTSKGWTWPIMGLIALGLALTLWACGKHPQLFRRCAAVALICATMPPFVSAWLATR